ncbi:MAG: hypothetical protein GY847_14040 [Proteobacteria bacterium]|nr:hypothetical protein [Pseudomonadota bacterium]
MEAVPAGAPHLVVLLENKKKNDMKKSELIPIMQLRRKSHLVVCFSLILNLHGCATSTMEDNSVNIAEISQPKKTKEIRDKSILNYIGTYIYKKTTDAWNGSDMDKVVKTDCLEISVLEKDEILIEVSTWGDNLHGCHTTGIFERMSEDGSKLYFMVEEEPKCELIIVANKDNLKITSDIPADCSASSCGASVYIVGAQFDVDSKNSEIEHCSQANEN